MSSSASLLVVAGPSGSGKTTFMRMLRAGELDPAIEATLPAGARHWPQFGHQRVNSPDLSGRFILHYSTTHAPKTGSTYEDDLVLEPLRHAGCAAVLTIRAAPDLVRVQRRGRDAERQREGAFRRSLRLLRRFRRRVTGRSRGIVLLYDEPGWIEKTYAAWDEYLAKEAARRKLFLLDVTHRRPAGFCLMATSSQS